MKREIVFAERMEVCQNHPERSEIFWLEQMLIKAGHPYFFNFWEYLKPTPFNQDGGDPEKDIDWDTYDFVIEMERMNGNDLTTIDIRFTPNGELLQIMEPLPAAGDVKLYSGLTAEAAMEIIEEFFKTA